ncbi:alkaline shock response membrane anchor protein AmaP [Kitasatospora sp. NPDC004240]
MSRTVVNRLLIGLAGLVVLVVGLLVVAGAFDLYTRLEVDPPDRWPLISPDQPLLSTRSRTRWVDEPWWWPTVVAVLLVLAGGSLGWLVAQLRRHGPSALTVATPGAPGLRLRLRAGALEEAVETGTAALPEVERASVRLIGRPRRPGLRGAVRLTPGGEPAVLLTHFETGPRTDALATLGLPALPADLRIRVVARPEKPPGRRGRRKHTRVR